MELITAWVSDYPTLFMCCVFCGLLVPFPEDVIVILAGTRVAAGDLAFGPAALVTGVGMLLRDLIAFTLAKRFSTYLLAKPRVMHFLGRRNVERWERIFAKNGGWGIFLIRFAVGTRVKLLVIAAMLGVRKRTMAVADALGMVIVAPLLLWIGSHYGPDILDGLRRFVKTLGLAGTGLLAAFVVAFVVWRNRRVREEDAAEAALAGTAPTGSPPAQSTPEESR